MYIYLIDLGTKAWKKDINYHIIISTLSVKSKKLLHDQITVHNHFKKRVNIYLSLCTYAQKQS